MPSTLPFTIFLPDAKATTAFAHRVAPHLKAGDCLLLSGGIGAGKTHFARALIQARLGRQEDVPSPTYTLVQTYEDTDPEIWHADLYRLTQADDVLELGLDDAFSDAITLIEWPDRLGGLAPADALHLTFETLDDGRILHIDSATADWLKRLTLAGTIHA